MNYTYITVLNSLNYLEGVKTLLYSLQKVKSKYPLVVVLPKGFDSTCQESIESWGAKVLYTDKIDLGDLCLDNKRQYWNETFFKLCIFNLTEFDKIVYVDCDMIIRKNIDHLFEMEHITAVQGGKLIYHWEDINSGLMVIKPNTIEFKELVCIFRKNCASVPEERSAIPLETEQCSVS